MGMNPLFVTVKCELAVVVHTSVASGVYRIEIS